MLRSVGNNGGESKGDLTLRQSSAVFVLVPATLAGLLPRSRKSLGVKKRVLVANDRHRRYRRRRRRCCRDRDRDRDIVVISYNLFFI